MKTKLFQIQRELLSSHIRRPFEASELTKKAPMAAAVLLYDEKPVSFLVTQLSPIVLKAFK